MPIEQFLNQVYLGDGMKLLKQLPDKCVDLVWSDIDYNVNYKYGIDRNKNYTKPFEEYINHYIELAKQCLRICKDDGNILFMNYPKQNAYLTVWLNQYCHDIHEYIWTYRTMMGFSNHHFTTAHRTIIHARLTENNRWYNQAVAQPYENQKDTRIKARIAEGSKGRAPYSWLYHDLVKNVSDEKSIHSCQVPQELFTTFLKASTQKEDTVLVLWAGSGGELEICKTLGRNYISAELDPDYHRMVEERLKTGIIDSKYRPNNRPATCIDKLKITTKERTIDDF